MTDLLFQSAAFVFLDGNHVSERFVRVNEFLLLNVHRGEKAY